MADRDAQVDAFTLGIDSDDTEAADILARARRAILHDGYRADVWQAIMAGAGTLETSDALDMLLTLAVYMEEHCSPAD